MLTECRPSTVRGDGKTRPVDTAVWQHFRNPSAIAQLRAGALKVQVFGSPFEHRSRVAYFTDVRAQLSNRRARIVVFFDPDTGMADRPAGSAHIGCSELADAWDELRTGDVLAVYQHSWRNPDWRQHAKVRFKTAVGLQPRMHDSSDGARDLVILAATRP